jgi:hypothetical protein
MNFKTYMLISEGVEGIIRELPSYYSGGIPAPLMANVVYNGLTTNDKAATAVKSLMADPAKYKQYNDAYKQIIQMLDAHMKTKGWISHSDGAWVEWFRKGITTGQKSDNQTTKMYISIDHSQAFDVVQKLAVLMRHLDSVQTDPASPVIGVKVPVNFGSYFKHVDNIVIHFYDKNAAPQIQQAVAAFQREAGVKQVSRDQYGRTEMGKDVRSADPQKGGSDTSLVAQQVVRNLDANRKAIEPLLKTNPQQAAQLVTQIISQIMKAASHRAV